MSTASAKTRKRARTASAALDIAVLHDETENLRGREGEEAHIGVWEAILPIEDSLKNLGHRIRRISLGMGIAEVLKQLQKSRPDVVFHLAETAFGETLGEARMATLLDLLGIPHTSSSPESLALCRDKLRAIAVMREFGIGTPLHAVSHNGRLPEALPLPPWISKPTLEDGSIGIESDAVTSDPLKLRRRVQKLYAKLRQPILIESFVEGREFNVGIVGDEILPLVEIDFTDLPGTESRIVNYESKWQYDTIYFKGTKMICPPKIAAPLAGRIARAGRAAIDALGVRGYARVDMRMDSSGKIYVLEVNPNPDLSLIAGMAKMAVAAGWGFNGLIERILNFARRPRS